MRFPSYLLLLEQYELLSVHYLCFSTWAYHRLTGGTESAGVKKIGNENISGVLQG